METPDERDENEEQDGDEEEEEEEETEESSDSETSGDDEEKKDDENKSISYAPFAILEANSSNELYVLARHKFKNEQLVRIPSIWKKAQKVL